MQQKLKFILAPLILSMLLITGCSSSPFEVEANITSELIPSPNIIEIVVNPLGDDGVELTFAWAMIANANNVSSYEILYRKTDSEAAFIPYQSGIIALTEKETLSTTYTTDEVPALGFGVYDFVMRGYDTTLLAGPASDIATANYKGAKQINTSVGSSETPGEFGSLGSGDEQFNSPSDVTIDSAGNIYVADTNNDRIVKYSSTGTFVTKTATNAGLVKPLGLCIDSNDVVYIMDTRNDRIMVTNSDLVVTQQIPLGNTFISPISCAANSTTTVAISNLLTNNIIFLDTTTPAITATHGSFGTGNLEYKGPVALEYVTHPTAGELLLVLDKSNKRITVISDATKTFVTSVNLESNSSSPLGMTASDDGSRIVISNTGLHRLDVYTFDGTTLSFTTSMGSEGSDTGEFKQPKGLNLDSSGNLLVVDSENHRIQSFKD